MYWMVMGPFNYITDKAVRIHKIRCLEKQRKPDKRESGEI